MHGVSERRTVELPGRRDQTDLELSGPPTLADDEVAQEAAPRASVERLELLRTAPFEHLVARPVARLGGQQAVLDVVNLLP